ncbi:hypothetical protein [Stackebrandtia nassauensis]|uniref:Uncharacterized protein n=1 Tax=Stackebrandtia nassauensis (strain DSM 44728 / CIP 108903 / NRRL B-16338 / NBRC 102104 / LLR-40K-21) TaxID=446470 RepID=D3Q612_STANL|nr:hypothetical protein [Stackebrandtia nassauensis]ADD40311.1 hypothetical protein Snas_0597 [Stackebrandtia nassauensis DSM 44728]
MGDEDYTGFATDCYNLWKAGHVYIPIVADTYAEASRSLGSIYAWHDGEAMGTNEEDVVFRNKMARGQSEAKQEFKDLRDLIQTILARTSQNLYDVGEVLEDAAKGFADRDKDNANEIGSARDQLDQQIDDYEKKVKEDEKDADRDDEPIAPEGEAETKPDNSRDDSDVVKDILPEEE